MDFKIGDKVIKNPETWIADDRDEHGWRGTGIGIIVEPPFELDNNTVDVRWEGGRYFEPIIGLIKVMKFELWEKIENNQVTESLLIGEDHPNKENLTKNMIFNKIFEADTHEEIAEKYIYHYKQLKK